MSKILFGKRRWRIKLTSRLVRPGDIELGYFAGRVGSRIPKAKYGVPSPWNRNCLVATGDTRELALTRADRVVSGMIWQGVRSYFRSERAG